MAVLGLTTKECGKSAIGRKVSIIILNWNGRFLGELLDKAIASALNQSYLNTEVILADNGSTDGSAGYVREKYGEGVRVLEFPKNYGYSMGNNLATKYVSPETRYILFQNPDVILSQNYVEELVKIIENDKGIGVAQGLEISYDSDLDAKSLEIGGFVDSLGSGVPILETWRYFPLDSLSLRYFGSRPVTLPVLWASGAAMFVKRDVFEMVGGFPAEFFMYCDEIDLCIRVICDGYRVLGTNRTSYCHVATSLTSKLSWPAIWYFTFRNKWLLMIRYFPLKGVIKAMITLPIEFGQNIYRIWDKPLESQQNMMKPRLMIRALWYLFRNLERELKIRRRYRPYRCIYVGFIIDIFPAPYIVTQWQRSNRIRKMCIKEEQNLASVL